MKDSDSTTILLLLIASYTAPFEWAQWLFSILACLLATLGLIGYFVDSNARRQADKVLDELNIKRRNDNEN